jgi:hypothetical protein
MRPPLAPALALLLASVAPAAADSARVLPLASDRVRAGQVVEVRWAGLPSDAQEAELLLSLDGGRHFAIRVSGEVDPREGRVRFRVPNLPAESAMVRLRYGNAAEEHVSAPGAPFRIEADASRPLERRQIHEGLWWTGVDPDAPTPRAANWTSDQPALERAHGERVAALAPQDPLAQCSLPAGVAAGRVRTNAATVAAAAPRPNVPQRVPRRE